MGELRAAIIGFGLAGSLFHGELIAATPGLGVAAIVTSDPSRRQRAARRFPAAALCASVDELWARAADLDLVVVASPNTHHVPQATQALALGLAVVVDKPLALTAAEGRRLLASAREADGLLSVFQNRRWDSDHLTVKRLLAAGALGDVLRYEARFERFRPQLARGDAGWRETLPPDAGGGLLLDLGSHLVDQALSLFGPASHVYCESSHRRGGAGDDDDFISLRHAAGIRSHLSLSALAGAPGPRLRILGTRAAYVPEALDGQEQALHAGIGDGAGWGIEPESRWGALVRGDEREPVPAEPGDWPAFYRQMAAAVRGDAPVPVDPADAVRVLEVLDAARTSAATASVVRIDA